MPLANPLPVLVEPELRAAEEHLSAAGARLLIGSVVDMAGVIRTKQVPARRARAFHVAGMGAAPCWNVFCIDNAIAFTSRIGVVGDLRLRADLGVARYLGDGIAWAPAEFFTQYGEPAPVCPRGRLRAAQAELEAEGLAVLVGCELELVLTHPDGAPLSNHSWKAYGLGGVLDREAFVADLAGRCEAVGLPLEQIHAEYADNQFEFSFAPADPITAADNLVLGRLLAGRVARRHCLGVSLSPLPFAGGGGNGAHQHVSLHRDGVPLLSGGDGPHGLTGAGAAAIGGIVAGLPDVVAVLAGSVLSGHRLQPGYWAGAFACWGLENREAAVRFCAATPGNPHGASIEVKCIDPSANPYLSTATILGLARDGMARNASLPPEAAVNPAELAADEDRSGLVRLPSDQAVALDALAASPIAGRLLGPDILDALLAVRRHERDAYGKEDVTALADRFRFAWSA